MKKTKIKTRLIVSFSIVIIFTLITAAIGFIGQEKSYRYIKELSGKQYLADNAIKMCRIQVNNAARAIRDMYIDEDEAKSAEHEQTVTESLQTLDTYIKVLHTNYGKEDGLVEKYETALTDWAEIGERSLSLLKDDKHSEVQTILTEECSPALQEVVSLSKQLTESTQQMRDEMVEESLVSTNWSKIIMIIMAVISAVFGILIALEITKGIVRPLYEVRDAVRGMAEGRLDTHIAYVGPDAVGEIAEDTRKSLAILSSYVEEIDSAMGKMAADNFNVQLSQRFVGDFESIEQSIKTFIVKMSNTIENIRGTADQVALSSGQISDGAQTLSDGSAQQASAVEELAANLNEISSVVQKNAENAKEASVKAKNAGTEMDRSSEQMKEMIVAMEEISNNSSEIDKIIKTIEDIAFQTNILALNAAVEAARAGQAGKGFAVVADEVRNLASKSAIASKDTAAMIEKSIKSVENGTQIVGVTDKYLTQAVSRVEEVVGLVGDISESSDAQATSIVQVTQGIEQISAVVHTNSATAEESASASEELSGQANTLKELVNRFQVKESSANDRGEVS